MTRKQTRVFKSYKDFEPTLDLHLVMWKVNCFGSFSDWYIKKGTRIPDFRVMGRIGKVWSNLRITERARQGTH